MFTINNEIWCVYLVAPNDFVLITPEGQMALGVCDDATRAIYISNSLHGEAFERVLCHEIVHAAMFAYNVLLSHDQEELLAEIIAIFGEEIIDITDVMFDTIKRGRY